MIKGKATIITTLPKKLLVVLLVQVDETFLFDIITSYITAYLGNQEGILEQLGGAHEDEKETRPLVAPLQKFAAAPEPNSSQLQPNSSKLRAGKSKGEVGRVHQNQSMVTITINQNTSISYARTSICFTIET